MFNNRPVQVLRPQGVAALWLQRLTVAGSLFFFIKGLIWLAAGYWLLAR
jgi:hypothetical protein